MIWLVDLAFSRGRIELRLADGRRIRVPVRQFPAIKRLSLRQRQQWQILDGIGFTFQDCDAGFHLPGLTHPCQRGTGARSFPTDFHGFYHGFSPILADHARWTILIRENPCRNR